MKRFDGNALSWALADGVVELALHRPPANELSMASWAELEQFAESLKSLESEAVALIVYSQLKSGFGAGGDLYEMYARLRAAGQGRGLEELRQIVERGHRVLNAIDITPLVSIAAVHGVCFGGAFELALTCDLMIADETARFCFPELRLGLIPGGGGIPRLKRDCKNAIVRDLLLTGRSINAQKADAAGLISQLAGEGESLRIARSTAAQLRKFDTHARVVAKRFIKSIPNEELLREIDIFCELFSRPAIMADLRKFVQSRGGLPYLP
jgi:enoyl-CoA hydratase/carnithine racemase